MKRWIVRKPNKENSERIMREAEVSSLCANVLSARGFENAAEAAERLSINELFDPFLLKDMKEAADAINNAIENFERICVYGDYDCDGITSTVMLYSYLECMGADVTYYIPERSEGYGLNIDSVKKIAEQDTKIIITVDNGISAIKESELIYELGMKLIVTDHHQPGDKLPHAEAVVDPHRVDCPSIFKKLCGAGVVLKLIAALEGGDYNIAFEEYGELAAIATVADIVELSGENRYIVTHGLKRLENSDRIGINALIDKSGIKRPFTSTSIAFGLAPRINASGRFGSPKLAADLLLTDDSSKAEQLSNELDKLNESRKKTENEIIDNICEKINSDPEIICSRVIVLSGENWHHGVIGIVAARILERFDKPCFIITIEGDESRGSARAFGTFSVYKALDYCSDLLIKFGGHMGAGGFSLKTSDIPKFNQRLQQYAAENYKIMPIPDITADKVILPSEITVENIDDLKILEPFGEGNDQPVFVIAGAEIVDIISLSKGVHTKLRIKYVNLYFNALMFRRSPQEIFLKKGEKADFMITLDTQVYNEKRNISIIVKDYRKSGLEQNKYFAAKDTYEKFKRGEQLPENYYKKICPNRSELIPVYKTIVGGKYNIETLYMSLMSNDMNYCKLNICADVFAELGLVNINYFTQEISAVKGAPKANLDNSKILNMLKATSNKDHLTTLN